eukprot:TRINITY_DN7586_c0_g1_i3.p1 TRINITY_DN7586_c0_g1~~TRINITY_DN7586_c0_g1_i3.p1  ORF type:complete len:187 (+),score=60.39 TRINITY_DN7586_c0_g1_i3:62-622(+)
MGDKQEDSIAPLSASSESTSSSKENLIPPLSRSRSSTTGGKKPAKKQSSSGSFATNAGSLITPSLGTAEKKKLKKMKKKVSEKDSTIIDLQRRIQELEAEKEAMQKELQQRGGSLPLSSSTASSSESLQVKTYCFDLPNSPLNIRYSEESGSEKILEAATLEKLLEKLTVDGLLPFVFHFCTRTLR